MFRLEIKKYFICLSRNIFSTTGIWKEDLSLEMKKEIEMCWKHFVCCSDKQLQAEENKYYILPMFPYPSGALHMGHVRVYSISDTLARLHRLLGKQVIHPMGWDAFGLPAENAAIDHNLPPYNWTKSNINHMKNQLQQLGFDFDWNRELATCDPDYYQWSQFLFLKLLEKDLVYHKESYVNWDPVDQTVLANEQIDENNCSWRSGAKVEKKLMKQWFVKTTRYAKSLYEDLKDLKDWNEVTKIQQNWIGECNGCVFELPIQLNEEILEKMPIFTYEPEYIFGVSFIALSSSHLLNQSRYYKSSEKSTDLNSGIPLVITAVHPLTGKSLPVFVTDSVDYLECRESHFGIPCINRKDELFAKKNNLPIISVVDNDGNLMNSYQFTGIKASETQEAIKKTALAQNCGGYNTSLKLKDWLISRQRYWGTPIPIIHCPSCKIVPVPYAELPVKLPLLSNLSRRGTSPLTKVHEWINITCYKCGSPARREVDTMDTFFDSSWYFCRFLDPNNKKEPFSKAIVDKLMPINLYIGGIEHATLHLYYARFMSHFCHDAGLTSFKEPFLSFLAQGVVMAQSYKVASSGKYLRKDEIDFSGKTPVEKGTGNALVVDWEKMSKSKYNGVDPKEVIDNYSVDTTRLLIMSGEVPKSHKLFTYDTFEDIEAWQRRLWLLIHKFRKIRCLQSQACQLSNEERNTFENDLFELRNYFTYKMTRYMIKDQLINSAIKCLQAFTSELGIGKGSITFSVYKMQSEDKKELPEEIVQSSKEYEKAVCTLVIMLSCLAPHFASELWLGIATLPKKKNNYLWSEDVLSQRWPEIDTNYQPNIFIEINEYEKCFLKITREDLHNLTKTSALDHVMKFPKVQKILEDCNYTNYSFKISGDYAAHLNFNIIEEEKEVQKEKKKGGKAQI